MSKNDVRSIANYVLHFCEQEKNHTIVDDPETLDLLIGMNNLRFQKIMYFLYGAYYSQTKAELFDAKFMAFKFGPIIEVLYEANKKATKNKGYKAIPFKTYQDFSYSNLDIDYDLVDEILIKLSCFSTWTLVEMSHEPTSPWSDTEQSKEIGKKIIWDYFENFEIN